MNVPGYYNRLSFLFQAGVSITRIVGFFRQPDLSPDARTYDPRSGMFKHLGLLPLDQIRVTVGLLLK